MSGRATAADGEARVIAATATLPSRFVGGAAAAVPVLSGWLLVVVGTDLVVTRLVLRLAIFVPKSDAAAAVVGSLARVGAIVDTLVPIVAALLLGALLASAGTWRAPLAWRIGLVSTGGVAAGGIALAALAPTPTGMAVLEGLVAVAAVLFATTGIRAVAGAEHWSGGDVAVGLGLVALGLATALAALARVAEAAAVLADVPSLAARSLPLFLAGEVAFVVAATLVGAGRLRAVSVGSRSMRLGLAAGVLLGTVVVGASLTVPATASILLIWSVGLVSGLLPLAVVGVAAGLALGGLVALASVRRGLAVGLGIVLLAGYGLPASGLVLAGLLGLAAAGRALVAGGSGPSPAARARDALLAEPGSSAAHEGRSSRVSDRPALTAAELLAARCAMPPGHRPHGGIRVPGLSRRSLLALASLVPALIAVNAVSESLRAAAAALRPSPAGTSATRCAACGAPDHRMLDRACPATPRVRPGARA